MKNKEDIFDKKLSLRGLIFGMAAYTGSSIFGPLVFFGTVGYVLDKLTGRKPLFLLLGILLAFVVTNILIFKKVRILSDKFEKECDKKENNKEKN